MNFKDKDRKGKEGERGRKGERERGREEKGEEKGEVGFGKVEKKIDVRGGFIESFA